MVVRCSNGVGFIVLEAEPAFNTGISIEIYDAANPLNLIDVLPDSFGRKWTDPRKGPGAGEFKVFADNPHVTANPTLLRAGNIVRMYLDRVPRFAFKIEKRQLVQIQDGEDSRVAWHITGRGALSLLEDGQIWPAGGLLGDPERPFVEATPGTVLNTLITEVQARSNSILSQITEGYTTTTDSNNIPYDLNVTLDERAGTDLLRVAERITELAADVYMSPLLELNIFNSRGVDRTLQTLDVGPVVLQKGSNIIELERSEDAVIRNALLIETPGGFVERIEAASITEYRRREAYISLGNITDSTQIDRAASAVFERSANPAEAITIRVTNAEGRRPYADFGPGDWVFAPDINGALERYRVASLTIAENAAGEIEAIPELATITDDLEERLSKWLKSMARGTMGGTAADVTEPNKAPAEVVKAVDEGVEDHRATHPHPDELSDLSDVDVTGLVDADVLTYDAVAGEWVPEAPADIAALINLDDLADVQAPSPTDGQVLKWDDGANAWIPATDLTGGGGGGSGGGAEWLGRASVESAPGGPNDDEFDGSGLGGWTEVKTAGSTSLFTERYGAAHWRHRDNGSAGHLHALLKPLTIGVGDYIESAVKVHRRIATDVGIGLIMSDGDTHGAGSQVVAWFFSGNIGRAQAYTNFTTAGANSGDQSLVSGTPTGMGPFFVRLKLEAANTFGMYVSGDGFEWQAFTTSFARTLTPTHAGLVVVRWTALTPVAIWPRFYYFRVNPADEA